MKYTHEEILRRARPEFDYIWDTSNREQIDGGKPFDIGDYATQLEIMLLSRFDEAGLARYSAGKGGVAGMRKSRQGGATDETV